MKLWIDDIRPAPYGYFWLQSVNQAKEFIECSELAIERLMEKGHEAFLSRDYALRDTFYSKANAEDIEVIDIDHDAGDYAADGGDYIKLLDWLEETGRNFPIKLHSMNPVGVRNMRAIIEKNNWKEIK